MNGYNHIKGFNLFGALQQTGAEFGGCDELSGEYGLLLAVLVRGVRDAMGDTAPIYHDGEHQKVVREAQVWIFRGGQSGEDRFTFIDVCEVLKISPGTIRRLIRRWIDEGERFGAPCIHKWGDVALELVDG